ncbi:MAG: hypothetical protein ACLRMZ_20070 [Blautia marasmi]
MPQETAEILLNMDEAEEAEFRRLLKWKRYLMTALLWRQQMRKLAAAGRNGCRRRGTAGRGD